MGIAPEPPGDPMGRSGGLSVGSLFFLGIWHTLMFNSRHQWFCLRGAPWYAKGGCMGLHRKWQTLTKAHSNTIFIYFILSLLFISFFHRRKFWTQRTLTLNLSGTEVTLTTRGEDMGGGVTPRDTRQHLASTQLSITTGHVLFYLLWGDARQGPSYSPHALTYRDGKQAGTSVSQPRYLCFPSSSPHHEL
jgi:hypothetical protein